MKKASKIVILLIVLMVAAIGFAAHVVFDVEKGSMGQVSYTHSMEPTLMGGDWVIMFPGEKPRIGDIIEFDCFAPDKCHDGAMHRLVSIDSKGCMYIDGDNQPIAWDTRDYGCLMPDEIHIDGVVHKIWPLF